MIKAVIFDMDGLMIDSERYTYEAYLRECAKYGYQMNLRYYKSLVGYNMETIRRKLMEHYGACFPLERIVSAVFDNLQNRFEQDGVPLKCGLLELLQFVKSHGYAAVVATSSDRNRVDRILSLAGISSFFDASVCGNEITHGKPDPEIFLTACDKVAVRPEEALVLEDSQWGIAAAHSAGIRCICVPDMKRPQKSFAQKTVAVLDSLEQVIPYLEQDALAATRAFDFCHACLVCSDEQKALDFYVDGLGLTVHATSYSANRKAKKLQLYLNGHYVIELFIMEKAACRNYAAYSLGLDHLSFFVDNVQHVLQSMQRRGFETTKIKLDADTGKPYAFVYDPDGLKTELYER